MDNATNISSNLTVPVVSPTHFDHVTPPPQPTPPPEPTKKTNPALVVILVALSVFLLASLVGNVYFYIKNYKLQKNLADNNSALERQNSIVEKIESELGSSIKSVDKVPALRPVKNFIYLHDWQLRFELPDNLERVSYIFNQSPDASVCFNAVHKGNAFFPAFADIKQNPGGMGCIIKVPTSKGQTNSETKLSYGEHILTRGDFNYFYVAPTKLFSKDSSEQNLETSSVKIIKNMLIHPNFYE